MIKRNFLITILLISFNFQAQEGTSSPYSFYGIGSLKFKGTTENRAMGGISIYNDSIHMNFRNPASYVGKNLFSFNNEARLVKFTVGIGHSDTKLETSETSDNTTTTTTFDYLGLNIPMGKFGMGFGLIPYSSVGYKLESRNSIDSIQYKYSGNGGVNKVFLGFGYLISDNLSVGFDAHYNFGNLQNSALEFLYDDEELPLDYQAREINRSDLSGINYNLGISYNRIINKKTQIVSSLTYSPSYNLKSKNKRTFASVIVNDNNIEYPINQIEVDLLSLDLEETDLKMPSKMSIGLGIGSIKNWFIGSEYTMIKSSVFSSDLLDIENATFEDSSVLSVGGFYIPDYNSFNKLWQRIVYRSGIYFEKTGLNINNQSIKEFGISFGLGIPVGRLFSNINTVVEIGSRGTTNENLVKENFVNFQLSLSLNDRWFVKRKYN